MRISFLKFSMSAKSVFITILLSFILGCGNSLYINYKELNSKTQDMEVKMKKIIAVAIYIGI